MHALLLEGGDFAAGPAIDDADLRIAVNFLHEADASRAEDAAVAVQHQRGAEIHVGLDAFAIEHAPRKIHPAFGRAERVGKILQRTLAALVADWAVEGMVDQQKLENACSRLDDPRLERVHDHAVGAKRRT